MKFLSLTCLVLECKDSNVGGPNGWAYVIFSGLLGLRSVIIRVALSEAQRMIYLEANGTESSGPLICRGRAFPRHFYCVRSRPHYRQALSFNLS